MRRIAALFRIRDEVEHETTRRSRFTRPPNPSAALQAERAKIMSEIEGADRKLARLAETESASRR